MSLATRLAAPAEVKAATAGGGVAAFAAMVGLTWGPSTIAIMGLGVFIRPLQMEFGWSRAQVALAATVINLTVMVLSPIQGWLVDRFGSRRVVLPSLVAFAASLMALYALPRSLQVFYAAWSLVVIAGVGLLPGGYLRVVGTWFDRRLGLAMGLANAGIGLGNILVPLVATAVIAAYGWRWAYVTFGLIVLFLVTPVCWAWLRERPSESAVPALDRTRASGLRAAAFKTAVKTPAFAVATVAYFLLGLVNTALISQQAPLLIDAGMTPQNAAFVQSLFGLFLLFGRLAAGALLDRLFAPLVMIAVCLGGVAACLIYATGAHGNVVFLAAALLGLMVGAEFDVLGYLVRRYFGPAAFGKTYGAIFAVFQLGGALGAAAFAYSHAAFGGYRQGLYAAALVLIAAAAVFAVLPKYPAAAAEA
jgi:MFS family permease